MHASTIDQPEPRRGSGLDLPIDLPRFFEPCLPASYIFLGRNWTAARARDEAIAARCSTHGEESAAAAIKRCRDHQHMSPV
jgi:hypothetical protein